MPEGLSELDPLATGDNIELEPFYYREEQPVAGRRSLVIGTRYFWEKWAPLLGPTLTVLIARLRMHCYYNRQTQERRDWCFPSQETLAREIGVSRWTVMRELKKPLARKFVRVQYRSRFDPQRRQTVRISSLYHVAMDDPLIEGDAEPSGLDLAMPLPAGAPESVPAPQAGGRNQANRRLPAAAMVQNATGPGMSKSPLKDVPEIQPCDVVDDVARELVTELISPRVAEELAQQYPAELIREKVARVHELARQRGALRNAPGFLRRAIEDDYPLQATGTDGAAAGLLEVRSTHLDAPSSVGPWAPAGRSSQAAGNIWEQAKAALRQEMPPAAYAQWLEMSTLLNYATGRVLIAVPDSHVQRYIQRRLLRTAEAAVSTLCGVPTAVEVVVRSTEAAD